MRAFGSQCLVAMTALLGACNAEIGSSGEEDAGGSGNAAAATASAEGKAEDGKFSIKAPGIDLKLDIPDALAERAEVQGDSNILYPGAKLGGMHVEGGTGGGNGGAVELRFASADAPDKIAAWYRDAARAADFAINSASREGAGLLLSGKQAGKGDSFSVRLMPAVGGGTDGRLLLGDGG
jgi:hypothetical protein